MLLELSDHSVWSQAKELAGHDGLEGLEREATHVELVQEKAREERAEKELRAPAKEAERSSLCEGAEGERASLELTIERWHPNERSSHQP